jgi:AraC family transcriptional activator of pobA
MFMKKEPIPVYDIDAFRQTLPAADFYANTLRAHLAEHHFIFVPHKHDFYMCVLFTKGRGRHDIDFVSFEVKPGSVFFLTPGQMHNWFLSDDCDGFIFFHSRAYYDSIFSTRQIRDFPFFSSLYVTPALYLKGAALARITAAFSNVFGEYRSKEQKFKNYRLCSLIDLTYIDLARIYEPGHSRKEAKRGYLAKLKEMETMVDTNFRKNKKPSFYASQMNMTLKHLNRICRTCLNKTTSEIITDRVILEAKRMLKQPAFSVNEISDELGFEDVSYFIRLFKKQTGDTPLRFSTQ